MTLALLAVPEVVGYARIAGMPVVTGLYTMLLPMVANISSWSATGKPASRARMAHTAARVPPALSPPTARRWAT